MEQEKETYSVIGAAMAVHNELGMGFLENVYQEALEHEFKINKIPFEREKRININYKDTILQSYYIVDFVCFNNVLVEIKASKNISGIDKSQLINYLKATKLEKGLLINFGTQKLEYKRIILDQ